MRPMKTACFCAALFCLVTAPSWAANDALAQAQSVPTGERVANYLQTMLTAVGQLLIIKHPPGMISDSNNTYRATVLYDPDRKVIQISLIGTQTDPKTLKALLEFTKDEVLSLNKTIQKDFGATLGDTDIDISYLNVAMNKTLLSYKDGRYSQDIKLEDGPVSKPSASDNSVPGGNINGMP